MKRLIDLIFAYFALLVFAIPILMIALLVRIVDGKPIIFKQVRAGLHGRPFTIYKFRTMAKSLGYDGSLQCEAQRLTNLGSCLRASSLDELPELWNVICGDMSLVGPRPLLLDYLPLYNSCQARRHNVRPGITGWAQVNGRNNLSWEEKFRLDVWYVDNRTLSLDFYILLLTFYKVFRRDGIIPAGQAQMAQFTGSPPEHL
jgi:lipopolysaccharide/colanic/teichoic acid biosynthesis glycosyltransferase